MLRCKNCGELISRLDDVVLRVKLVNGEYDVIFGEDLVKDKYYKSNVSKVIAVEHIKDGCYGFWDVDLSPEELIEKVGGG